MSRLGAPFDGRRFHNLSGRGPHGLATLLRWMRTRQRQAWPTTIPAVSAPTPVARVEDGAIRVTLIGHSTVLIQVAGLNILTDPVWSDCAGPLSWLGVKRLGPPAIEFDALPRIDVVLLSHNHYDHLDRPTLRRLATRDDPQVLTGLGVARSVPCRQVVELDWWQTRSLGSGIRASYVPAEHFSGRGPFDRNKSLWGGFVLETPAGTIYFAGDSGDGAHFAAIRQQFGPMRLSLIPIGAYLPRWFMAPVHIDPAQAVAVSLTLQSATSLPIHFGAFPLADEGFAAPLDALATALAAAPPMDFRTPAFGEPVVLRPASELQLSPGCGPS